MKKAGPTPTGAGWNSGGIFQMKSFPLRSVGSQPQARLPSTPAPVRDTHITSRCENQRGSIHQEESGVC